VDQTENVETYDTVSASSPPTNNGNRASSSRMGPGPDSGSSAPSSIPHSLGTSRDEEDDDDVCSARQFNDHGGFR
jgi:hypothetical protein